MVIDGPFTETKELIAGFWVWEVESLPHAIDWVKKCPNPMPEDSEIEIRPYVEMADFGEAFTPELQEQEAAIRAVELGLNQPNFLDSTETLHCGYQSTLFHGDASTYPSSMGSVLCPAQARSKMPGMYPSSESAGIRNRIAILII